MGLAFKVFMTQRRIRHKCIILFFQVGKHHQAMSSDSENSMPSWFVIVGLRIGYSIVLSKSSYRFNWPNGFCCLSEVKYLRESNPLQCSFEPFRRTLPQDALTTGVRRPWANTLNKLNPDDFGVVQKRFHDVSICKKSYFDGNSYTNRC